MRNGISFSDDQNISGAQEAQTALGRISADAAFALSINGGPPIAVTIARTQTKTNVTMDDVVADVSNAALTAAESPPR